MKKLSYIILGFIIGALLTYLFCPRQSPEMTSVDTNVKVPKDTISVAEAVTLFKNWQKNNETEIDSLLEVEGSRKKTTNVAWSLSDVRDYLDYAEAKSDSLGFKMTGITVFMGNYGKDPNPVKKNRNTLFIVPTGHEATSKASSLNLFSPPGGGGLPIPPLNDGGGGQGDYNK